MLVHKEFQDLDPTIQAQTIVITGIICNFALLSKTTFVTLEMRKPSWSCRKRAGIRNRSKDYGLKPQLRMIYTLEIVSRDIKIIQNYFLFYNESMNLMYS